MAHQPLTAAQERFLKLLRRLHRKNGAPPTIRELQTAARFKSPRSVTQFLDALEEAGYISRRGGARNIRVLEAAASELEPEREVTGVSLTSSKRPQDVAQWQYPPPSDWQKFERMCRDLWSQIWQDENTRRNGRGGQAQDGVDVFGQISGKGWAGVQCKRRDAFADDALTVDELRKFADAAKIFKPALTVFIVAYTGRSDRSLQEAARLITDEHQGLGLFEVHVASWDDILEYSGTYSSVFAKYYPSGSIVDEDALKRSSEEVVSRLLEKLPVRLAEVRNDDARGVALTVAQSIADGAILEEYNSELDHAKALIEQFRHKEALDYLEPLERRIFGRARPPIRFRLLSNKAAAKAGLGDLAEAGRLFVEAYQYNPDDEKSLCNRAVGHLFLGQDREAADFARKVIERNPVNTRAHEILVRCAPLTESLEEIIRSIPSPLQESEDVAHALSQAARARGDAELAIHWLEISLAKSDGRAPGILADLGAMLLETIMARGEVLNGLQVKPADKVRLERCAAVLSNALDVLSASGNREQLASLFLNRSTALDLLGEPRRALADADRALENAPVDPRVVKQKAFLLHKVGETDAAIDLLRSILANPDVPEVALILSQVLYEKGERVAVVGLLERSIPECPPGNLRNEERRFLVHILLEEGNVEAARRWATQMRTEAPTDVLTLVDAAKVEGRAGDGGAASALLDEALQYIADVTPFQHAIALANALYSLERFADAARVYERVVDPTVDSPFVDRLIYAYYRAGEAEKALQACRARKSGDRRLATQIELAILEDVGDLDGAAKIAGAYLASHPDDLEIRARLAGVLFRSFRMSELDALLAQPIDPDSAPIDAGYQLAGMLAERDQHARCIALAYEIRRRHFDVGEAHMKYVGLFFGRSRQLDPLLESDVVAKDFAVQLQEDGGASRWYVVEERPDASAARHEVGVDSDLGRKLIGKRLNEEIVIPGRLSETRLLVTEIKSKYVYALHESLSLLPNQFPETKGLERIPVPEGAVLETFKKILDAASIGGQDASQAQKLYLDLKITIGTLANMIGKEPIEVWDGLVGSRWGVRSCLGTPQEREDALATFKRCGSVVLDITALLTAEDIGALELLKTCFTERLVTQSTVDLLISAIAEKKGPRSQGFMVAYKDGEKYLREDVTPEQIQRYQARLEDLQGWVKESCRVVPVMGLTKLDKERRSELEQLVGRSFLESMIAARENNAPLYSDDFGTRSFALEQFGVAGFWSQIVVIGALERQVVSQQFVDRIAVELVLRNHKHTTLNGAALLEAARKSEWTNGGDFSRVAAALGDPTTDFTSAVVVVADFAALLWSEPVVDLRREALFRAALDAIAEQKAANEVVRHVVRHINQRFRLNPLVGNRVLRILAAWRSLKLR